MHHVVALVGPMQPTFELGCATEVFGTTRSSVERLYTFEVCTEKPGVIATTAGYGMTVSSGLSAITRADTVVIPGWVPVGQHLTDRVRAALVEAHAHGARLVTICSGVFALAQTGLLDGRTATAHPDRARQLQEEFPNVIVDITHAYIDHGDVATSGGAGAGIELCLQLVLRDQGATYASSLKRDMVMPRRDTVDTPERGDPLSPASPPGDLLAWVSRRLDTPISVADMAAHVGVSRRTLARQFATHLGTSPGAWLLSHRINSAREHLEQTDLTVEAIAVRVGLGSAVNLRRRFHAQVGTTPSAYRRTRWPADHRYNAAP